MRIWPDTRRSRETLWYVRGMGRLIHGNRRRHSLTTPEYRVWVSMKTRCLNPNNRTFARYGGRGIGVCARWLTFSNFLADMGQRPSASHSLERRNNNGPYSPDNCCWATSEQQAKNRRSNHRITFNGQTKNLEEWADALGINRQTLSTRLNQQGWPVEKALTQPVARRSV